VCQSGPCGRQPIPFSEQDVPGIYYYRDHYYAPAILIFHSGLRLIARPLCVAESCGFAFSLANPSTICKEMGPNPLWTWSVKHFVISRSVVQSQSPTPFRFSRVCGFQKRYKKRYNLKLDDYSRRPAQNRIVQLESENTCQNVFDYR
jgi:hypothetical protein